MQRQPKSVKDASQLLQLIDLLSTTGRQIIDEWSKESERPDMIVPILPSRELHEMQRTVLAAAGSLIEMVSEPSSRLVEVSLQYFEARALHIAAERRIPDLLSSAHARRDRGHGAGLSIKEISNATGIESFKLCKINRVAIMSPRPSIFRYSLLLPSSLSFGCAKHLPRNSSTSTMPVLYTHLQRGTK